MRFTFCWRSAARLPTVIESTATTHSSGAQSGAQRGKHLVDHAQQQRKGRGLGRGGEQRDNRRRRAFVDIGRPDVERRSGDLEENADQHQRQRGEHQRLILGGGQRRWAIS